MIPPTPDHSRWFAEEVQPHESALRSYLRARFPSLSDVDDLVQESYARLIRAKRFGPVAYARAFLFATARIAALDIFQQRQVVSIEPEPKKNKLDIVADVPNTTEAARKEQELDLLAEAVRRLPERCRQVMTLRLLYSLSQKEIAARLSISEHTVKAQLAKGVRRCAEFFEEHGLAPAVKEESP